MIGSEIGKIRKRRPLVAIVLSLIMPGLGHVYCGKIIVGLLLAFVAVLPLPLNMFKLSIHHKYHSVTGVVFIGLLLSILIYLVAIIDSAYKAKQAKPDFALKDYNRWYAYVLLVLISTGGSTGTAMYVRANYIEAFRVPTASNYPTIVPNDRFLANKLVYSSKDPKRGDMVVFINPENRQINFIKRVVAIAGDTVEIKGGELYINDQKLPRQKLPDTVLSNIRIKVDGTPLEGDTFEETNGKVKYKIFLAKAPHDKTSGDFVKITVPSYHCFVLGDNRTLSQDSRHFGPIPLATIKGRADYLYWPAKDWSRFGFWRPVWPFSK
jgi:signal peptidase I